MVYDVDLSPGHPSLFTTVDCSGALQLWDMTSSDPEVPVAMAKGVQGAGWAMNKVCWETAPKGKTVVMGR